MAATTTPSSSSPPKPTVAVTVSSLTKKPQPIPWTHQETINLIRAYQEKWYSLKRGPLRGSQWEEVAVVVAARCGYDYNHPSKTALQCRHKMEKLRQRHRSEKHRLTATSSAVSSRSWQYFRLMDDLERGPLPISARPVLHGFPISDEDSDGERRKKRSMEMMKETERFRLEMENKRIRMILESQWRIVDSIGKAFGSS
ncbi:hypothetical protein TSUD_232420 [Trifolium subterraneum]|uniref:Myb-like domain-containing protein n=1 Tax=Trifolium subterraneum TaxID=3900 RepID=A0A2Z6MMQ9_TRISU|nr:hypothetical protein TSUD_232420 [Trifolium subterraneum]